MKLDRAVSLRQSAVGASVFHFACSEHETCIRREETFGEVTTRVWKKANDVAAVLGLGDVEGRDRAKQIIEADLRREQASLYDSAEAAIEDIAIRLAEINHELMHMANA